MFSISPSGELRLLHYQRYFYDSAGLEGFAHWLGGIALFVLLFCMWVLLGLHQRRSRAPSRSEGPSAAVSQKA